MTCRCPLIDRTTGAAKLLMEKFKLWLVTGWVKETWGAQGASTIIFKEKLDSAEDFWASSRDVLRKVLWKMAGIIFESVRVRVEVSLGSSLCTNLKCFLPYHNPRVPFIFCHHSRVGFGNYSIDLRGSAPMSHSLLSSKSIFPLACSKWHALPILAPMMKNMLLAKRFNTDTTLEHATSQRRKK